MKVEQESFETSVTAYQPSERKDPEPISSATPLKLTSEHQTSY